MTPRIPGYVLERPLGRGGMGTVFAATSSSGREVALKCIPVQSDLDHVRARHEIEVLARLRHPGIVALLDHGVASGHVWLAMERARESLARRPPKDGTSLHRAVVQILETLAYAHAKGILHRDLKPGNLVWTNAGTVCIADFGVARMGLQPDHASSGTAGFMAPEQRRGDAWDQGPWTDLYALGRIVGHGWPTAPAGWQAWMAWLTDPSPGQRPRMAAHALEGLPQPVPGALDSVVEEETLATRAFVGEGTTTASTAMTWHSAPIPPSPPEVPSRTDRLPVQLANFCEPPLFGREPLIATLWNELRTGERRHLRVHADPGVGSTAVLERLHLLLTLAGVVTWRAEAGQTPRGFVSRLTRDDDDRWWARRRGEGASGRESSTSSEAITTSVLIRMAAAEVGTVVVLADKPDPDLANMLAGLAKADLDIAVVEVCHDPENPMVVEPIANSVLDAALSAWLERLTPEILQVQRSTVGHPGWFFRALRSQSAEPRDVSAALCALAWWDGTSEAFLTFCGAQGIPVPLDRWFARGWISSGRERFTFSDSAVLAAARRSTPPELEPHLDALLPHLRDDGERGLLLRGFGQEEASIALLLKHGTTLVRQGCHRRLGQLTKELADRIDSDDPRRHRWTALRLTALHHTEHDPAEALALAERALTERHDNDWLPGATYVISHHHRRGDYEEALAVLDRIDDVDRHPTLVSALAGLYFDTGRYDDVEALHRRAAGVPARTRGEAALMSGDLELSKTIATNALVGADAFDTMALNNLLGALAVMQDDLEGGEAHFREAARVGHGLIDVLQPLTNAAAVAAFRGHRARAAREASLLLPRLERCSWRQNIGWCCLTLWATHEDPDMASSYGDRAREIFERPTTDSQLRLARMAIENLQAAKRPELAGLAERWVDQ